MTLIHVCTFCQKPFKIASYRVQQGKGKYCSKACALAALPPRLERICLTCHASFSVRAYQERKPRRGLYCSAACRIEGTRRPVHRFFWTRVARCTHEDWCPYCCWPWLGHRDSEGYGLTGAVDPKQRRAHRIAWELFHQSPMPSDMHGAHFCHCRICCNPAHIHPATPLANIQEGVMQRRHAYGSRNSLSKLQESDIPLMFQMAREGMTYGDIGEVFAISRVQVSNIIRRKQWRHVAIPE